MASISGTLGVLNYLYFVGIEKSTKLIWLLFYQLQEEPFISINNGLICLFQVHRNFRTKCRDPSDLLPKQVLVHAQLTYGVALRLLVHRGDDFHQLQLRPKGFGREPAKQAAELRGPRTFLSLPSDRPTDLRAHASLHTAGRVFQASILRHVRYAVNGTEGVHSKEPTRISLLRHAGRLERLRQAT